jgi:hypothetical protein
MDGVLGDKPLKLQLIGTGLKGTILFGEDAYDLALRGSGL